MDNNLRLAKEIMSHVGGVGNIASLNHCSTRLRLRVNNEENFDVEAIKKIDGVLDVVKAIGGFQIIVGNNVSKVYAAIVANYDVKVGEEGGRVAGNVFE
ncbi:MAG: PTS glucose/sucrose transporter subunit IIB, partial [Holdemania filiformis]